MGGFSIWHWIIVLSLIAWAVAVGMILKRMGFSPFWAILAFFPVFNFIGIWIVALSRWPIEDRSAPLPGTFE